MEIEEDVYIAQKIHTITSKAGHNVMFAWLPITRVYRWWNDEHIESGGIAHIVIGGSTLCITGYDKRYTVRRDMEGSRRICKVCERTARKHGLI